MSLIAKIIFFQEVILTEPVGKVLKEALTLPSPLQMEVPTANRWRAKIPSLTT
jgi:hypothetical protein